MAAARALVIDPIPRPAAYLSLTCGISSSKYRFTTGAVGSDTIYDACLTFASLASVAYLCPTLTESNLPRAIKKRAIRGV